MTGVGAVGGVGLGGSVQEVAGGHAAATPVSGIVSGERAGAARAAIADVPDVAGVSRAAGAASRFDFDAIVIGGGPAGLSAALILVRDRRRVLVVDSNRPRHHVTLQTHGFLTRDGVAPLTLRRLAREEVEAYDEGEVRFATVSSVARRGGGFVVAAEGLRDRVVFEASARTVLVAAGLREVLPEIPRINEFYGLALHSCVECDAYEKSDWPLALIGSSVDMVDRALLVAQWTPSLTVFTLGSDAIDDTGERLLAERGIAVDRRDVVGFRGAWDNLDGIELADGGFVPCVGGFVRPDYVANVEYLGGLAPELDADGLIVVDGDGRTSVPGLYAAGDVTPPGPQRLIVAAGDGARVAAVVNLDLLRWG